MPGSEVSIAIEKAGLTSEEYQRICGLLGREPNGLELALFGVMWSEHCSYKSSRRELKRLPQTGAKVLQGPGENAGAVDVGDGYAVVFKIESHNHPTAIEPYQGAATGVGGIVRDIFTMGARPVALLNSLRFGPPDHERSRYLFKRAVKGIGDYGNCLGIPTVGGEAFFARAYQDNPLVNAMCVGIIKKEHLVRARTENPTRTVMIIGARTGRDGIQGASFASDELTEASEKDRPAVQVGDPFMEKLLLEACLELIDAGVIEGLQDLGAAGLTSSASEVAARSGCGIEVDTALVPRREAGMTPFEVMLSESQERMLVLPLPGREEAVMEILHRWGLVAAIIGSMAPHGNLVVKDKERVVACVPVALLVDKAPVLDRPAQKPPGEAKKIRLEEPDHRTLKDQFLHMLTSPNLACREWIYRQYDFMVGTNTVAGPGTGAAMVRIADSRRALVISCDGNGRYTALNPFRGGALAVAEGARNVVALGARPVAITDGLNFGNPEKTEVAWQFKEVIKGMAAACRALEVPVVSGNVSFFNDTEGKSIYPTPIVGTVGVIDNLERRIKPGLQKEGDTIVLLGTTGYDLGGSEYLQWVFGREEGQPPELDLEREKLVQEALLAANEKGLIQSAQDISEGGLAMALVEMALTGGLGAAIRLPEGLPSHVGLFSESPSRFIVTCLPEARAELLAFFSGLGIPRQVLGQVIKDVLNIVGFFTIPLKEMEKRWQEALPKAMEDR